MRTSSEARLECVQGNIASQPDMQAVVNAANSALRPGAGVAGAIHRAAGPALYEECRGLAPIEVGQAVVTGAHQLPNRWVIHTLGPVYGVDLPSDELLAACYRNSLRLAEEKGIESLAFPAISTGVFGYPLDEAARIAIETIRETLPGLRAVALVRLVLFSSSDLRIHQSVLRGDPV